MVTLRLKLTMRYGHLLPSGYFKFFIFNNFIMWNNSKLDE